LNKFVISFNLLLCIVMLVVSVLPKIQEGKTKRDFTFTYYDEQKG
jgi:hypothetical protein